MSPGSTKLDVRDALRQSGEVGSDLLAVDWSATPLGQPEEWPSSLSTMVRVLLGSRFSMWMAWGPELNFFCNEAYRRDTLGRKYPWALGRPAREVWAEIWPEIGPRIAAVMQTGVATWDEALLLFLERSGYVEESYHTFSYSPIPDDEGAITGMLCVVTEDTERVIAERHMATLRDLGSVAANLSDESEYLAAAAEQLSADARSLPFVLIYLADEDGSARLAASAGIQPGHPAAPVAIAADDPNPVWPIAEAIRGEMRVEDLTGRFERLPTGAWDQPPQQALVMPLLGTGADAPYGCLVAAVNPFRPLDGDYRSFVALIAQRLASGVAAARSYRTERLRAEQLAELDRAKTAFFSNVSHEFRTPLTLMLAPLQDAISAEEGMGAGQVELVHRNGMRLLKLVNALLDFSRLEAGRMRAEFRPLDAGKLTAELASTFGDATVRAGLTLAIDAPQLDSQLFLDADMWERIVLNLLSNAFKATLEGTITVALREVDGAAELTVADTGPGIPTDELPKLFQRFHRVRTAQARSHEGTGIGLALVKELVELHGGEVRVSSEVGQGSTFTVRIPFGRDHLPAEQVREQAVEPSRAIAELFVEEALSWIPNGRHGTGGEIPGPASAPRSDSRVLIADDNPDLREYLSRLLSPYFRVEAVNDGAEALTRIREHAPDLVITDAMMPVLDGFGLLAELRSTPETYELPVIMLSARAGEEASIAGLEAGADDYLPKPFSGRELLARVRAHLELSLERRRASQQVRAERLRLEQTLEQLPAGVIIAEAPSGKTLLINDQMERILGVTLGVEGIDDYSRYRPFRQPEGPEAGAERRPLVAAIKHGQAVHDEIFLYPGEDGTNKTIRASASPIRSLDGEIFAAVLVAQDVTERMLVQRLLSEQRDILAMIARGTPLAETLTEIVQCVQRLSEYGGRASILLVSADGRHLGDGTAPDLPAAYNDAIEGIGIGPSVGSCGTAAFRRETVIVTDTQSDPLWADFRDLAAEHGLRACWSTPILATEGDLVGTFAVYHERATGPSPLDRRVVELLSRTAAVAIERARDAAARSRQLAELQSSLLPPTLPEVPGVQVAVSYHAGDRSLEVGGDFYDLFPLDGDEWGFVIGDVCGHGAEAAAVTALTRHTTRAIARLQDDPGQVLAFVSDALHDSGYDRYCTAVYGRLKVEGGRVSFRLASGGHPPPLIRRASGEVEAIVEHGPLIGVFPGSEFPQVAGGLREGDALFLHTDGLFERNPRIDGEPGLHAALSRAGADSARHLLEAVECAALGSPPASRDDAAILALLAAAPAAPAA